MADSAPCEGGQGRNVRGDHPFFSSSETSLIGHKNGANRFGQKSGIARRIMMIDSAEKRGQIIKHLEEALALSDELEDGPTGFLIERALDEARARQFRPAS